MKATLQDRLRVHHSLILVQLGAIAHDLCTYVSDSSCARMLVTHNNSATGVVLRTTSTTHHLLDVDVAVLAESLSSPAGCPLDDNEMCG